MFNDWSEAKMHLIILPVIAGIVIGSFTNLLAVKMLFRPFNPWKIGNYQIPFTPGLIPKRKCEIAEQLGYMVETHLFTPKGMKKFLEKSGLTISIYNKLTDKLMLYRELTIGEVLTGMFSEKWKSYLKEFGEKSINSLINSQKIKDMKLADILSEERKNGIENQIEKISVLIIKQIKEYMKSIEGRRFIISMMKEFLVNKKVLSLFASFIVEGNQFQEKLFIDLEKILDKEETQGFISKMLLKEWNDIKNLNLSSLLDQKSVNTELNRLFDKGINEIQGMSLDNLLKVLERKDLIKNVYELSVEFLINKIDKFFPYLSIAKVVQEEVNRFSLEELEKMIIDVAGKELKMITYMGGVLGGIIGLFQGVLYLLL